jgi:uncharacterized membrane protein YfcA
MQIYLPIAEVSMNIFLLLGMGGVVGFLSGMFGVGGGFLLTPLLIFAGVPPAVAVATQSNQIMGASVSGALSHFRRGTLDIRLGLVLSIGGALGSFLGAWIFKLLTVVGQIDLAISLLYVVFLGAIGSLMMTESLRALIRRWRGLPPVIRRRHRTWIDALPFKVRFKKSKLYISVLTPLVLGGLIGILSAILGVGGGFILVPALIYLLGMPTNIVIGTSLFQITIVTGIITFLHAVNTQTVDVVMALILLFGAVIGAQVGAHHGNRLRGETVRALLALIVLTVSLLMAYGLFVPPFNLYTVQIMRAEG